EFEVVQSRSPHGFTIVASGDFDRAPVPHLLSPAGPRRAPGHPPVPSRPPLAPTPQRPRGRACPAPHHHGSVRGRLPFVSSRTRRPNPPASGGRTSATWRYTVGHHRGRSSGSPRTADTSSHVPVTVQRVTKW